MRFGFEKINPYHKQIIVKQPNLSFIDLGITGYQETLNQQKALWQKRVNDQIPNTLLLTEHLPVFTLGKHGKLDNLLISQDKLLDKKIGLYRIERGGDITFHGPGQLVGYPIFKIEQLVGVKKFIQRIEQCLIKTLAHFNIHAFINPLYIGVFTDYGKIASIGIAIQKRVSFHGFALNVNTDLSYFDLINPCGQKQIKMTSMQKILDKNIDINSVKEKIRQEFINLFSLNIT